MTSHAPATAVLALLASLATLSPLAALAALAAPPASGFIVELREPASADVGQKRIQSVVTGQALALAARLRAGQRMRSVVPDVREQRLAVTPNDSRFASQ